MRLSASLFRFRGFLLFVIFVFGFWAPFDRLGGAHPGSTWLWLSGTLTSLGILSIAGSTLLVMGVAILLALLAAMLRTWAAAYLGDDVIQDHEFHAEHIVAGGPYRYVRNPLYVALWLHTFALAILMPTGGALFVVVAITLLIVAMIRAEEHKLAAEGGEAYAAYRRKVPRVLPAILPRVPAGAERPLWLLGFLGEIYWWGVVVTYLAFAGRYNVTILEQGVLISLGVSIVLRGIMRRDKSPDRASLGPGAQAG